MIAIFAALLVAGAPSVVGSWTLMGQPFVTFEKNGACTMEDGPCTWRVSGSTLFVTGDGDTDAIPFTLTATSLTLSMGGVPVTLDRAGKAPPVASAPVASAPAAQPQAPSTHKGDPNDPLAKLLLSSPWCNFWFNKTTGYSGSVRVQYFPDGSYQIGSKSEGYSSGAGGTFASEGHAGSSGLWYVQKGQLFGTPPPSEQNPRPDPNAFFPLPLVVTRNSNGFPIITADGKEYSQCQ